MDVKDDVEFMLSMLESHWDADFLQLGKTKHMITLLQGQSPPERLLLSTMVTKINHRGKSQERAFVVTDHALYNFEGNKVKRRVPLSNVTAISVTEVGEEDFLIHIANSYDFWLRSPRRIRILRTINQALMK